MRVAVDALGIVAGGGLTYARHLLPAMLDIDPKLEFIVYTAPRLSQILPLHHERIRVVFCDWSGKSVYHRIISQQLMLPRWVKRDKCKVLFSLAPPVPHKSPCPTVVTIHNMLPFCQQAIRKTRLAGRPRIAYLRLATKVSAQRATRVIAVSNTLRECVIASPVVSSNKVTTIYYGSPKTSSQANRSTSADLERLGIHEEFVLYVSYLHPYKNQLELIEAFNMFIRQTRVDAQLVLVGGDYDRTYRRYLYRSIEAMQLSHRIVLTGELPYDFLPTVYLAAKVFAFPSICEACPNILLEAMAHGLPMVVANASSMPEICGDTALYFDAENTVDMATALSQAWGDNRLRKMLSYKARLRARDFDWYYTANRTLAVLKDAAGRR